MATASSLGRSWDFSVSHCLGGNLSPVPKKKLFQKRPEGKLIRSNEERLRQHITGGEQKESGGLR